MTRDRFVIDFSLKVVLVIYPFCFSISALLFFVLVSCWACLLYLLQRLRVLDEFYCIFHSFEKYKVVAFFAYGFEEVLALDCLDESFI